MPSRYPRAVGKQPQLGWSFLDWFSDYEKPAPLARIPAVDNYWNAGVNMAYGRSAAYPPRSGGDTGLKPRGTRRASRAWWDFLGASPSAQIGVDAFERANMQLAYGNVNDAKAELGDLFNDIMGSIVPGWDQRPEFLKKIVVKPDPNKIVQAAQKIAPNAGADIVRAANANGMQIYVNTPAGQVNVTPETAQLYYGNYQFLSRAQDTLGSLSPMTWLAVGGIGLGLFLIMKR